MVVNTQHEPESAAVSIAPMTNRDKGSQPPPIRPFQPYKLVTLGHTYTLECRERGFKQALRASVQTIDDLQISKMTSSVARRHRQ